MKDLSLELLLNKEIKTDNNTALIVIDMINDVCRKGGVFDEIGFDISSFNKIEKNISELTYSFSNKKREVIYVRSFYDFEYLPESLIEKFIKFGLNKLDFSKKGYWGSQLIDSIPETATAFVFKSNYSPFSEGYSALFNKQLLSDNKNYFLSKSNLDNEFKNNGKLILKDFYSQSLKNEVNAIYKNEVTFPLTLHGYLKSKSIDSLVCVGGSTHVCLAATVYSASERGYKVILPIDAIASEDTEKHNIFLQNFDMFNSTLTLKSTLI